MTPVPTPAAALGFTLRTFGPQLVLGDNWFLHNLYRPPMPDQAIQAEDGSIFLPKTGNGYGIASGTLVGPHRFAGKAFGGGYYIEVAASFLALPTPGNQVPAIWGNDAESTVDFLTPYHSIEVDLMEQNQQGGQSYSSGLHDWSYQPDGKTKNDIRSNLPHIAIPAMGFGPIHRYGFAFKPGWCCFYLDGQPSTPPVTWNPYDPNAAMPPIVGKSAFSVLEARHLLLYISTSDGAPMWVKSASVWQASDAGNRRT